MGEYKTKVIANIKRVMSEKGISNTALAEKIGTSQPVISQILADKYTLTVDRVEEIANALGVSAEVLFQTTAPITSEEKTVLNHYNLIKKALIKYTNGR